MAKAHQGGHAQGGAHRGEAGLFRINLYEQVTGKQRLHRFGPFVAPELAHSDFRQVGLKALLLQVSLGRVFLARLGLHGVPVLHTATACGITWLHTMAAGVSIIKRSALSLP